MNEKVGDHRTYGRALVVRFYHKGSNLVFSVVQLALKVTTCSSTDHESESSLPYCLDKLSKEEPTMK